ncbi:MAG: glutaminyl-peptide cyclotransferase, partial [Candidatus Eremiobacteraeota bacterium]|nr:glutaminyl-peptide cyclotransferase [Candidatus Eremiobacteraeota bacterium]
MPFLLLLLLLLFGCEQGDSVAVDGSAGVTPATPVPFRRFRVVATFPHNTNAFTEGLLFSGGNLFESTGLRGQSSVRRVDLTTGNVLNQTNLAANLFGEGLALFNNQLFMVTLEGNGFFFNPATLAQQGQFNVPPPGWGLASTPTGLVMSNGSNLLRFLDANNLSVTGVLDVRDQGVPVTGLNELEWVDGMILANLYPTDRIAAIDP